MLNDIHNLFHSFLKLFGGIDGTFHTALHRMLDVSNTSDLTALLTMLVTLHLFVFCKRIYSCLTQMVLMTTFIVCFLYEFHNFFWYKNQAVFTPEDYVWTYMEGALLSCILLLFTHVHSLEMKRYHAMLSEKKLRYMYHEYTNQTKVFGSNFIRLTCDYASVKNFMAIKIIVLQMVAWSLLIISIIGSLVSRFSGG